MNKTTERQSLMDEDGICITSERVTTPAGDFPMDGIRGVESRVKKPLWGPVLLVLLGTLNLAFGMQTGALFDLLAAGLMIGGGLYWRMRSTRHVLVLTTPTGKTDVWFTTDEDQLKRAMTLIESVPRQNG